MSLPQAHGCAGDRSAGLVAHFDAHGRVRLERDRAEVERAARGQLDVALLELAVADRLDRHAQLLVLLGTQARDRDAAFRVGAHLAAHVHEALRHRHHVVAAVELVADDHRFDRLGGVLVDDLRRDHDARVEREFDSRCAARDFDALAADVVVEEAARALRDPHAIALADRQAAQREAAVGHRLGRAFCRQREVAHHLRELRAHLAERFVAARAAHHACHRVVRRSTQHANVLRAFGDRSHAAADVRAGRHHDQQIGDRLSRRSREAFARRGRMLVVAHAQREIAGRHVRHLEAAVLVGEHVTEEAAHHVEHLAGDHVHPVAAHHRAERPAAAEAHAAARATRSGLVGLRRDAHHRRAFDRLVLVVDHAAGDDRAARQREHADVDILRGRAVDELVRELERARLRFDLQLRTFAVWHEAERAVVRRHHLDARRHAFAHALRHLARVLPIEVAGAERTLREHGRDARAHHRARNRQALLVLHRADDRRRVAELRSDRRRRLRALRLGFLLGLLRRAERGVRLVLRRLGRGRGVELRRRSHLVATASGQPEREAGGAKDEEQGDVSEVLHGGSAGGCAKSARAQAGALARGEGADCSRTRPRTCQRVVEAAVDPDTAALPRHCTGCPASGHCCGTRRKLLMS